MIQPMLGAFKSHGFIWEEFKQILNSSTKFNWALKMYNLAASCLLSRHGWYQTHTHMILRNSSTDLDFYLHYIYGPCSHRTSLK